MSDNIDTEVVTEVSGIDIIEPLVPPTAIPQPPAPPERVRLYGVNPNDLVGHSFILGGIVYNALVNNGQPALANEAQSRIGRAPTFEMAVSIALEYVDF